MLHQHNYDLREDQEAQDGSAPVDVMSKKRKKKSKEEKMKKVPKLTDEHIDCDLEQTKEGNREHVESEAFEDESGAIEEEEEEKGETFAVIGRVKRDWTKPVKSVLPDWVSNPVNFCCDIDEKLPVDQLTGVVDKRIIDSLKHHKIISLFPVQSRLIPYLINSFQSSNLLRPRDVCVSSPTGSGKTLAFVIPIIHSLITRIVAHIRVLVLLPVSDLAFQVHQVFDKFCQGTSLKVGLAVGHKSFEEEQNALIRKSGDEKYRSLVDILVATPGRLIDLCQRAPGFSLRNLKILVLDEADRLMSDLQSNCLEEIEKSIFDATFNAKIPCSCYVDEKSTRVCIDSSCSCLLSSSSISRPIQKILFSATLSKDLEKLEAISLFKPIFFKATAKNSTAKETKHFISVIPNELKELIVVTKPDKKPLVIWYLVEVLKYRKVLCFTGSVDNTHRLFLFLQQIPDVVVAEFSSKLHSRKRRKLFSKFLNGKIDLIVCSDIFARGLDVEGIDCVICYDPPRNATAYIHRIGRTARAGREGTAITLLTSQQRGHFNMVVRKVHDKKANNKDLVENLTIKKSALKQLQEKYKEALSTLSKEIGREKKLEKFRKKTPRIYKMPINSK